MTQIKVKFRLFASKCLSSLEKKRKKIKPFQTSLFTTLIYGCFVIVWHYILIYDVEYLYHSYNALSDVKDPLLITA